MQEKAFLRLFVRALFHTVWTYLAIASTLVTFLPLPANWRMAVPFGFLLLFVVSAYRAAWSIQRKHDEELEGLQAKLRALQVRPYNAEQEKLVDDKLSRCSTTQRDLLRFLLQRGRTEAEKLADECRQGQSAYSDAVLRLSGEGLVSRVEEPRHGRSGTTLLFEVNPAFAEVLRDKLFPRNERDLDPHFRP